MIKSSLAEFDDSSCTYVNFFNGYLELGFKEIIVFAKNGNHHKIDCIIRLSKIEYQAKRYDHMLLNEAIQDSNRRNRPFGILASWIAVGVRAPMIP